MQAIRLAALGLPFHALDRKSDCASHFCKVHAFPVIIGACRTRPMSAICFTPATCPCPESRAALFASPMRVKAAMSKATPDSHTSHLAEQNASSGLFDLSGEEWRCALGAVNHFDDCAEVFLGQWTLRMKAAGYLSFTTARRFLTSLLRFPLPTQFRLIGYSCIPDLSPNIHSGALHTERAF